MKLSALLAAIPFLLAACGGGDGSSSTQAAAAPSSAAASPEPTAAAPAPTATAQPAQTTQTASAEPTTTTTAATSPASTSTASTPSTSTSTSTTSTQNQTSTSAPQQTSTSTTTPTTTASPTTTAPVLVEYYGDSIIWGWLPNNDWVRVDQPEPAVVGSDTGLNVQNMGSPGRLAEHALAGDTVYPAWDKQMAQSKATHVVIEYHSHDTVADTTARVRKLIQVAKASGKKVIVETIGPGNHSGNLSWEQISQAQRDAATAENVPVIDQSAYLKDYLASTGKSVWDICADGLHPNPDIYIMKGHYSAKQLTVLK